MNGLTVILGAIAVLALATGSWQVFALLVLAVMYCEVAYRPLPPRGFVRDSDGSLLPDERERHV